MLLHEEQKEAEHTPVSSRVTPLELAEAVAALEARKEAERARQAETISISDAIHHLGLNTPEAEVLSEVEALRQQRQRKMQQEQRARTRLRLIFATFATLTVLVIATLGLMNFRLRHALKNATLSFTPLPMQLLSQVPDGRIVHCDSVTLNKLAAGLVTPDQISVDARPFTSDVAAAQQFLNEWAITKSGGQILVTSWASADQALVVNNNQQGFVYSNPPQWLPTANVVPVQLPAYRFANSTQGDYLATGATTKEGPGVTQSLSVAPSESALASLITVYILKNQDALSTKTYYPNNFEISVKDKVVHIKGTTEKTEWKEHVTSLAVEVLQRVNMPMKVVNDMKVTHSSK